LTALGISIPIALGYSGNYQYANILALSLFNMPKDIALAYSLVSYLLGICIILLLSLIFLPVMPISIKEIKAQLRNRNKKIAPIRSIKTDPKMVIVSFKYTG